MIVKQPPPFVPPRGEGGIYGFVNIIFVFLLYTVVPYFPPPLGEGEGGGGYIPSAISIAFLRAPSLLLTSCNS